MINNIRILNANPYYDMRRHALKTMGRVPKKEEQFNSDWVKQSIISRHSQIRCVLVEIEFTTSKSIRDQILRSKHGFVEPFVQSQRPDRNDGKPRDPNAPSTWIHVFNIEGLVKMAADRLCSCTETNTRKEIEDLKSEMMLHEDPMAKTIGEMLVPNCGLYGACKEWDKKDCFKLCAFDNEIIGRINDYNLRREYVRKNY